MTDTPPTEPDAAEVSPPSDALSADVSAPIDEFLDHPETGVTRERPARQADTAPEQAPASALNPFKAVIDTVLGEHPDWRAAALERTPDGFDFWAGSEPRAQFLSFVMANGLRYIPPQDTTPSIWAPPNRDAA